MSYGSESYGSSSYGGEAGGPRSITTTLVDSIVTSDSIKKDVGRTRSDSITASENFEAKRIIMLTLTDSITASEAKKRDIHRPESESITISDVYARLATYTRTILSPMAISDGVQTKSNFADLLNTIETMIRVIGKNPVETVSLVEVFNKDFSHNLSDSQSLTDSVSHAQGKEYVSLVNIWDIMGHGQGRYVYDSMSFSEVFSAHKWTETGTGTGTWGESNVSTGIWTEHRVDTGDW